MIKTHVLQLLKDHRKDLDKFGVDSLYLFGSVARDEETSISDIDLLVVFTDKATFDKYMDLKFYLEEILNRKVDLVTESALRPEIKQYVLEDLIRAA